MSDTCKDYYNPSSSTKVKHILIGIAVMVGIMVFVMVSYKVYIERKMKREMKGEVGKTLEQYYKYMENYERDENAGSQLREELYVEEKGGLEHGYRPEGV